MAVLSDPISDFLIRFKNATRAEKQTFVVPFSKMKAEVARILKEQGYLWSYEIKNDGKFPEILVKPRYTNGVPALTDLKKVSKSGRRQYVGAREIPRVLNGMGISIISTSRGIMSGMEAKRQNIGGEILAIVW